MDYGYCNTALVPCRAEPSDKAEQTTQLLFGEFYEVHETTEKWMRILTVLDQYECWIDRKLHRPLDASYVEHFSKDRCRIVEVPLLKIIHTESGSPVMISYGSILPEHGDGLFSIGKDHYHYDPSQLKPKGDVSLTDFAREFTNAPYLWGGKSLFGIDCSGLTQVVYRCFGIWLPRDAWQQEQVGEPVTDPAAIRPGDLAYFCNTEGRVTHVGICSEDGEIIHASGRGRTDKLDTQGIKIRETGQYSHQLKSIKRVA